MDSSQKTVTVILRFDESYSSDVLEAMKNELESIMRPEGLQVEWQFYEDALGKEIFHDWAVVRLRGSCGSQDSEAQDEIQGRLAQTHLSDGTPTSFADVFCDRVRNLLWTQIASESLLRAEFLLGRALGRVMAHEIYHILAKTTKHGTWGVARPAFTRQDLVTGEIRFEKRDSELIRESLVPWNRAAESSGNER